METSTSELLARDVVANPGSDLGGRLDRFARALDTRLSTFGGGGELGQSTLLDALTERWALPDHIAGGLDVFSTDALSGLTHDWGSVVGYEGGEFDFFGPFVIPVDPVEHVEGLAAADVGRRARSARAMTPVPVAGRPRQQAPAPTERWRPAGAGRLSAYPAAMGGAGAIDSSLLRFPDARAEVLAGDRRAVLAEPGPAPDWSAAGGLAPAARGAERVADAVEARLIAEAAAPVDVWLVPAAAPAAARADASGRGLTRAPGRWTRRLGHEVASVLAAPRPGAPGAVGLAAEAAVGEAPDLGFVPRLGRPGGEAPQPMVSALVDEAAPGALVSPALPVAATPEPGGLAAPRAISTAARIGEATRTLARPTAMVAAPRMGAVTARTAPAVPATRAPLPALPTAAARLAAAVPATARFPRSVAAMSTAGDRQVATPDPAALAPAGQRALLPTLGSASSATLAHEVWQRALGAGVPASGVAPWSVAGRSGAAAAAPGVLLRATAAPAPVVGTSGDGAPRGAPVSGGVAARTDGRAAQIAAATAGGIPLAPVPRPARAQPAPWLAAPALPLSAVARARTGGPAAPVRPSARAADPVPALAAAHWMPAAVARVLPADASRAVTREVPGTLVAGRITPRGEDGAPGADRRGPMQGPAAAMTRLGRPSAAAPAPGAEVARSSVLRMLGGALLPAAVRPAIEAMVRAGAPLAVALRAVERLQAAAPGRAGRAAEAFRPVTATALAAPAPGAPARAARGEVGVVVAPRAAATAGAAPLAEPIHPAAGRAASPTLITLPAEAAATGPWRAAAGDAAAPLSPLERWVEQLQARFEAPERAVEAPAASSAAASGAVGEVVRRVAEAPGEATAEPSRTQTVASRRGERTPAVATGRAVGRAPATPRRGSRRGEWGGRVTQALADRISGRAVVPARPASGRAGTTLATPAGTFVAAPRAGAPAGAVEPGIPSRIAARDGGPPPSTGTPALGAFGWPAALRRVVEAYAEAEAPTLPGAAFAEQRPLGFARQAGAVEAAGALVSAGAPASGPAASEVPGGRSHPGPTSRVPAPRTMVDPRLPGVAAVAALALSGAVELRGLAARLATSAPARRRGSSASERSAGAPGAVVSPGAPSAEPAWTSPADSPRASGARTGRASAPDIAPLPVRGPLEAATVSLAERRLPPRVREMLAEAEGAALVAAPAAVAGAPAGPGAAPGSLVAPVAPAAEGSAAGGAGAPARVETRFAGPANLARALGAFDQAVRRQGGASAGPASAPGAVVAPVAPGADVPDAVGSLVDPGRPERRAERRAETRTRPAADLRGGVFGDRGPQIVQAPTAPGRVLVETGGTRALEGALRSTPGQRPQRKAEKVEEARHRLGKEQLDGELSPEDTERIAREVLDALKRELEFEAARQGEDSWD